MSLATHKAAIRAVVQTATGFTSAAVMWANDGGARPNYPYAELDLRGDDLVAEDHRYAHNEALPQGSDVELTIRQDREIMLSCRMFAKPGEFTAHYYMDLVRKALSRPSVHRTLGAVGVAVASRSSIQDISSTVNGERLLGAAMSVELNVATQETPVSERGSYIAKVQGTLTNTKTDDTDNVLPIDVDTEE